MSFVKSTLSMLSFADYAQDHASLLQILTQPDITGKDSGTTPLNNDPRFDRVIQLQADCGKSDYSGLRGRRNLFLQISDNSI